MPFKRRPLKVTGSSVGGRKKTRRTRAVSSPVVEHREGGESLYGASETPEDEELEGPVGVAEDLARVSSGQRSGVFRNVYSSIKERDIKNWRRLRRPLLDLAVSLESHPPEWSQWRKRRFGANALSDLSLSTRDIYINYIPIDCSGDALSHETIRHQIGVCFPNLPK